VFRDARTVEDGAVLETDVCIVGTGAAGVTCAAELRSTGRRVLVVEAGGLKPEPATEALNEFESTDMAVPVTSRERRFGGTTNSWWGKVALLDESDFVARDWLPGSGWPVSRSDLLPFYRRACDLLRIPDLTRFDAATAFGGKRPRLVGDGLEHKAFFWTRDALNFGSHYRRSVAGVSNVSTLLHANITEVCLDENGRVDRLAVATVNGRRFSIRPAIVILACGGIENARLLLASRSRSSKGVGNDAGLVGRYYMDHPRGASGIVEATPGMSALSPAYWAGKRSGAVRFRLGVGLSPAEQGEKQVLNSYVNLNPIYGGAAVAAIRNLYRRRAAALRDRSLLRSLVTGIPDVARYFAFKRYGRGSVQTLAIENFMEQEPRYANAVTLSERRDQFGNPLARVAWTLSERDRRSLRVLHATLDEALRRRGMGRLRLPLLSDAEEGWPVANDAAHHMGTTRMGTSPKTSVVDGSCRVHGIEDLYVAGSSVFPTGGSANPTLTIMALASRLADHVRSRLDRTITARPADGAVGAAQEKTA
jgi:choline dehydrogenase-like flavoprotein